MSSVRFAKPPGWQSVEKTLEKFHALGRELREFVATVSSELDQRAADAQRQAEAVRLAQQQAEQQRELLENLRRTSQAELEQIRQQLDRLSAARSEVESRRAQLDADRAAIDEVREQLAREKASWEEEKSQWLAQRREVAPGEMASLELQQQLEELQARLEAQRAQQAELREAAARVAPLEAALQEARHAQETTNQRYEAWCSQMQAQWDAQRREYEQQIETLQQELHASNEQLRALKKEAELVQNLRAELNAACEEFAQEKAAWEAQRDQTTNAADQEEMDRLTRRIADLEASLAALEKQKSALQQAAAKVAPLEAALQEARAAMSVTNKRYDEWREQTQVQWDSQKKELEQRVTALQSELEAARSHIRTLDQQHGSAAAALEQLEILRSDVARYQAEAQRYREAAEAAQQRLEQAGPGAPRGWESERAILEQELEEVRRRAAELSEINAEQRRQFETQRSELVVEIKRLRELLEKALQLNGNARPMPGNGCGPVRNGSGSANGDPVLDGLIAQFQSLRDDLMQQRRGTAMPAGKG